MKTTKKNNIIIDVYNGIIYNPFHFIYKRKGGRENIHDWY